MQHNLTKRQLNAIDKQIEGLYYKHAGGLQISLMRIGALFKDARDLHLGGAALEDAVKSAIAKHCIDPNRGA